MKTELEQIIQDMVKQLFNQDVIVTLTRPDSQFGDYTTTIALQLSKKIGQSPQAIANIIATHLKEASSYIEEVGVAGPGFLNLKLTGQTMWQSMAHKPAKTLLGNKVLVEYSDPNPFKPLHAGHLYTTLVGDTIARLVEHAGAETVRLNFGGDVGRHVGISMWAIVKALGGEQPEKLHHIAPVERPAWLGQRYVEGTAAFEDDLAAKTEILAYNKRVYDIHATQDHDSPFARIYWTCRQWSYDYFATLYEQLQVTPFDRFIPESEVTPLGLATVTEQLQNGVFTHSDGAVVYEGDEQKGLHTRVFINSEGLPTYETKDVGLSLTKWQDYHFDESIIITANEQEQYMQVVLAAIHNFAPELAERTRHLTHGVVKLQGGVKMSSRKGNVVTALEILEAARAAGQATGTHPTEETVLSAIKYAFAKNRIGGDIVYDPSESIALEGNSGPYLQYAHARARSILGKAGATSNELQVMSQELQPDERTLVRKLTEYAEAVERATAELMPHHICTYLYELAQEFNRFYEKNRVIGDDRENTRLSIVKQYADTLKNGLTLLGIHAPDRM